MRQRRPRTPPVSQSGSSRCGWPATRADPVRLTRRERDVLEVICAGHSNAEIAANLVLSTRTVDHHLSAVLAKLGARPASFAAAGPGGGALDQGQMRLDRTSRYPSGSAIVTPHRSQ